VGLLAHLHKYPHQLSGGQQQRVAIARALALRPEVMLFDEPTSALDPELVGDVLKVIQDLASEGMTMLIVTHEMEFALHISDRIVFMENGLLQVDVSPERLRQGGASADDPIERVRRFMQLSH
jgi:polar amino acid transport system permease protein